jgi:hypothetical protein
MLFEASVIEQGDRDIVVSELDLILGPVEVFPIELVDVDVFFNLLELFLLNPPFLYLINFAVVHQVVQIKFVEHLFVILLFEVLEVPVCDEVEPHVKHDAKFNQAIGLLFGPASARLQFVEACAIVLVAGAVIDYLGL